MPEGSAKAYEKIGMLMVGFEAPSAASYKVLGQKKMNTMPSGLTSLSKACQKSDALSSDKASTLNTGKTLFQSKCGTCHALHPESEFDATSGLLS